MIATMYPTRTVACPTCEGTGSHWDSDDVYAYVNNGGPWDDTVCPTCDGTGDLEIDLGFEVGCGGLGATY